MDVSTTSSATASPAAQGQSSPPAQKSMADYNTFLQLLIAQLKNQDPTKPTDPTQFVQQFATLAQVEQATSANAKLDKIIAGVEALKPAKPAT